MAIGYYYTLWIYRDNDRKETTLLMDEPVFRRKKSAFIRAQELIKYYGRVLVRKVKMGKDTCYEWRFAIDETNTCHFN